MKILSSMAGNVWKVMVNTGDKVELDQEIVILESMKMEIPVTSEVQGIVKSINVNEGDFVDEGDCIAELL
jgi:acetyl-CoA carboxylase biotin carboxyl carrier protein